jgi:hypothetical protein
VRRHLGWPVVGAQAQVLIDLVRVHDLARVHPPRRVPDRLEFAERVVKVRAEHAPQELAARLPVAVLARQRAAEADDQVGGLLDEAAVAVDPVRGGQVEVDAGVQAALAEVACINGRSSRRYSPIRSGGTAESSHPSQVSGDPGMRAVAPRPDLRTSHCAPALHAQLGCALTRVRHLEYFHDHQRIEALLFDGVPALKDGALVPDPERPGLGLALKRQDAARFAVDGP